MVQKVVVRYEDDLDGGPATGDQQSGKLHPLRRLL